MGKYASAGPLCDSHPGASGLATATGLGIGICRPYSQRQADPQADSVLETHSHDVLSQEKAIPFVTKWDIKGQETPLDVTVGWDLTPRCLAGEQGENRFARACPFDHLLVFRT